jgi:hypothetical protein
MGDVSDLYGIYCGHPEHAFQRVPRRFRSDLVVWHSGKYFWLSSGSIPSFREGKIGPRAAGNTTVQYKKGHFTLKLPGEFLWC